MRGRFLHALAPLLLGLAGCGPSADNPFADANRTREPRSDADLVFVSNAWAATADAGKELYAARADGSGLERITSFNENRRSDLIEAAFGNDRRRVTLRRVIDSNNDGRLDATDGIGLSVIDLSRGVEGELLAANWRVQGVDWAPAGTIVVHSAITPGSGTEDLYTIEPNGANLNPLTSTPTVRERRPRIDPSSSVAIFERIEDTAPGQVWLYQSGLQQFRITEGGAAGATLAGTPYRIGSDADPDFSPDSRAVVFRRLTATASGGGHWELLRAQLDSGAVTPLATGPRFRGAPDWGPKGIAFVEVDPTTLAPSVIVLQQDGSGRRVVATLPAGTDVAYPRWLP